MMEAVRVDGRLKFTGSQCPAVGFLNTHVDGFFSRQAPSLMAHATQQAKMHFVKGLSLLVKEPIMETCINSAALNRLGCPVYDPGAASFTHPIRPALSIS